MNFPYGESDFRLWDRIKLGLEPRPCVSLSKRLREASSNKSAAESFNTRKGECFRPATGHARARAQLGLAKIPTRKREETSQNLKIEDFFELAAKKNCHLEHLRDGRRTK